MHHVYIYIYVCVYVFVYVFLIFLLVRFLMFSVSHATMHFHFDLYFALLHIGPNHLSISSSHCCRGFLNGHFQSPRYRSKTAWVHLLSLNLVTNPAQKKFCFRYSVNKLFPQFSSQITSLRLCPEMIFPSLIFL